jgi:transcriptional regulator with XRE-family HTH domain
METFSKNLKARARELELSDAEVARRAGLNERRYGHYVTGAREPDLETLVRICRVLKTTPDHLLGFAEERSIDKAERERNALIARLTGAGDSLETDDLKVLVKQAEAFAKERMG